ncbi:MAG: type III-A CRISPR-associated protein Cas10/Csm1 [Syntrophobacteraceae bacterium]
MDENVLKIAIAAFMHDIGKLVDEVALDVSKEFLVNNAGLYQPFHNGRHTHKHAVYTAAFIEQMEALLPGRLNRAQWGLEDSFINLAAGHHNPETPMQWIIAIADRMSSGWDRTGFEDKYNFAVSPRDFRQTRLIPIFEQLLQVKPGGTAKHHYPLKVVSPWSIFPDRAEADNPITQDTAAAEYKDIALGFVNALGNLLHKEESLPLWFEHFESLMMLFASPVPAARAGKIVPDVSLFDHLKTTSALAVALYLFHKETQDMTIATIKDYDKRKFLFVSGDFYGIQNFIFADSGEAGKNRSKILRGRSFAVSLFSELAADMLCRKIGVPSISIVLNAAGKFTLIAPNTESVKQAVLEVEEQVNEWLFKISFGENALGIGCVEACGQDLVESRFVKLWDGLAHRMEAKKFKKVDLDRFGGTVSGYIDRFRNDLNSPLCPFCGKRPSCPDVEGSALIGEAQSSCRLCRDHILLGTGLVKKKRVAITLVSAKIEGEEKLLEPIFGEYQVAFVDGAMNEAARNGRLLKYWDISIASDGFLSKEIAAKFINGYVPVYDVKDALDPRLIGAAGSESGMSELAEQVQAGAPKMFRHLAAKALNFGESAEELCGIEALGVLKVDVDQLGVLFSCGLKDEQFTLSRLATMSRQLDWFFSLYVPYLLKSDARFGDVYTVFSGGDDLFLLGPWNRMITLAEFLRDRFEEYTCHNPEIHFSAGITLHKPHTPLGRLASDSEEALHSAKSAGGDGLTLFSETVKWDEFANLQSIKDTLQDWHQTKIINNAMLYRLNDFVGMVEREKALQKCEDIPINQMDCLKWRALFHYSVERNVGRGLDSNARKAKIQEFNEAASWLEKYGGALKIALWNVIYKGRKGGKR